MFGILAISSAIAEKIREYFGYLEISDRLVNAPTNNVGAYNLYLKARYNHLKWNNEGITSAIRYYEECIGMDPLFSWPYFGAAYCYIMYGSWGAKPEFLDIAGDYIDKGFRLNKDSFLGFYSKAMLCFWGRWDFIRGYEYYKKAISINPSYTEAEEGLVELYIAIGDFKQAMKHVQHMLMLDPLSKNHNFTIANIYYLTGQPDKAVEYIESGLKIDPNFTHLIELMLLCLMRLGKYEKLCDFLSQNPLAENPKACKALYQLIHNPGNPATVSFSEQENGRVKLIPWSLFLHTNLENHTMALDLLEKAAGTKRGST